jgi:hypothetical protein
MKVEGNQEGVKLNVTQQHLFCAHNVSLLGENINTINRSTEALLDTIKEVGLDINAVKTK